MSQMKTPIPAEESTIEDGESFHIVAETDDGPCGWPLRVTDLVEQTKKDGERVYYRMVEISKSRSGTGERNWSLPAPRYVPAVVAWFRDYWANVQG